MRAGRRLEVLDINDDPGSIIQAGEGLGRHFAVSEIKTWTGAQEVLAGRRTMPRPDLLLLDVNFEKDPSVALAAIADSAENGQGEVDPAARDGASKIVPVGPTLALCFLNQRMVMGFAAYS